MGAISPTVLLVLFLVGLLIAVLWVLMPFAIFGTKPLLRQLIEQERITNEHLRALRGGAAPGKKSDELRAF